MHKKLSNNLKELSTQFTLFTTSIIIADLISWAFFSILILKEAGDISSIVLSYFIMHTGGYIGFSIISFILDRIGYLHAYRLTMFFHMLASFMTVIFLNNFQSVFIILSFVRGFATGTYWPIRHSYMVKDMHKMNRAETLSIINATYMLLSVVLPTLAGALIVYTESYHASFIISSLLFLICIFVPFQYNKKSVSKISSSEITRILKRKYIKRFLTLSFFNSISNEFISIFITFLPFIFLKSEFKVGILTSAVALIAAFLSFIEKDKSEKLRENLAIFSWLVYFIANLVLSVFWIPSALILRSLLVPFSFALGDASKSDIEARLKDKILGDFRNESTLEMNLIAETVYFAARVISFIVLFLLFTQFEYIANSIIRISLVISALVFSSIYLFYKFLNNKIKLG